MIRTRLRVLVAGAGAAAMAAGAGVWLSGTAAAAPVHAAAVSASVPSAHAKRADRDDHGRHRDHRLILKASLAPSMPNDPAIFGAMPGKVPWAIKSGHVTLSARGRLKVTVKGLVVTPGGTNPIPDIAAQVYCGGSRVATTPTVPFSAKGNARIDRKVALPPFCAAPAVILEPAHGTSLDMMYIAFDGKAAK